METAIALLLLGLVWVHDEGNGDVGNGHDKSFHGIAEIEDGKIKSKRKVYNFIINKNNILKNNK